MKPIKQKSTNYLSFLEKNVIRNIFIIKINFKIALYVELFTFAYSKLSNKPGPLLIVLEDFEK